MNGRIYKIFLGLLAAGLLVGASFMQGSLVRDRDALGLNRFTELKGAPPVLTLVTMALGGFRGLISNVLWIRANDLQEEEKYFEMVQLADWITKLEPHMAQVWVVQAWNMTYNISVKFSDFADRWRWVRRGIELLRDEGLKYNPYDVLIHRELAWDFQHKMGADMDDANRYYKEQWAKEMETALGATNRPDWDALISPRTEDEKRRAELLRDKYKMDAKLMKQLDETYGPLEWRLPEAHAIYWAVDGLAAAKKNERKINPDDLLMLRRVIYQSMHEAFVRGRVIEATVNNKQRILDFGPNLAILPKADLAFKQAMVDDPKDRDHIEIGHRNLLRDGAYILYTYNQTADAARWFKFLSETYPDKPLLDGVTNSLPANITLDDYALARIQEEVDSSGHDTTKAILEGMERRAFLSLAAGEDERFVGLDRMAQKTLARYTEKHNIPAGNSLVRLPMPTLPEIRRDVLPGLLEGLAQQPELVARLKSRLPASLLAPPATNAPSASPGAGVTNSPPPGAFN